jgi:formate hydrogenlyase transcriptional activator
MADGMTDTASNTGTRSAPASPLSGALLYAPLVLRIWEAVSAERSLNEVLEAAADVLVPVVPFVSVGVVSFAPASIGLLSAHIVGFRHREDESTEDYIGRPEFSRRVPVPDKPVIPYGATDNELECFTGDHYMCADLLAREWWYPHEREMAASGIRAYTSLPLVVRGASIGTVFFTRIEPNGFPPAEMSVLTAASGPLSVAVANALANDEIRRLRDELAAENVELKSQLGQSPWFEGIVGDSAPMRALLARIEQVAPTDATVLITGETGTGKELVARALHQRSRRAAGPMVKVNCAAVPETLLASELFGHERGAFTGATERRRGRFEQAHGGTIFLDEIGELSETMQVLLLRVLQEREFERLGGTQSIKVDVRVVTATNRDLAADVESGRFRRDLYYRLNVFPLHVAPLRERPDDIAPLVATFAAKYGSRVGRPVTRVDARSLRALAAYPWPGNVRELENIVERAIIVSRGGTLRIDREILPGADVGASRLVEHLQESERAAIEAALSASGGRVSGAQGAARRLGLPASTLEFRIRKLGIDRFRHRRTRIRDGGLGIRD